MMHKYSLLLFGIFGICLFSCTITPTKPHIPYSGPNPELVRLARDNNLLASELRKLPELLDGINPTERGALKRLMNLYYDAPEVFDSVFGKMYCEGLPHVRKYCTPLQSLFWLVVDGKMDFAAESIEKYELKWLLFYAWAKKEKERWGKYAAVVDRLNSPQLLNIYQTWNFAYVGGTGNRPGYSRLIFLTKKGDCRDFTAFSVHCLKRAGYEARAIKVKSPSGGNFHVVCEFIENGKEYIIDNSCIGPCGGGGIQTKQEYVGNLPQIGLGYLDP